MSSITHCCRVMALATLMLASRAFAQYPEPAAPPPAADPGAAPQSTSAPMPPQQLDNLVAPIALYPDPLLGELWPRLLIQWKSPKLNNGYAITPGLEG